MASQIPWTKIKAEWLKGGVTQKKLAEKYHISVKTISNRAYKEGWKNEKGKIREKVEEELRTRVTRAKVDRLERLAAANDDLLEALEQAAAAAKAEPLTLLIDKQGTMRNAESLAKAIQTAVATQRDLHKLPTMDQTFEKKKWRDRMKLEREKLKGDAEIDTEIWKIVPPEGVTVDG